MNPETPVASAPLAPTTAPPLTEWPGPFGIFKHSKRVVLVNPWAILGLGVLNLIVGGIDRRTGGTATVLGVIGVLLSLWFTLGLVVLYLAGTRGEKLGAFSALKQSMQFYLKMIVATIVSIVLMVLSLLALVVPFFFVVPRLALVNYFLVDKKLGPIEAIKASWKATKGHSLKVWGIVAVTVLFSVLCLVLVGIYLVFLYQAALAVLYGFITRTTPQESPAVPDATIAEPA